MIYRFYEQNSGMGGVVYAKTEDEAREYAVDYLYKAFNFQRLGVNMIIWSIESDVDYCAQCPNAIATGY